MSKKRQGASTQVFEVRVIIFLHKASQIVWRWKDASLSAWYFMVHKERPGDGNTIPGTRDKVPLLRYIKVKDFEKAPADEWPSLSVWYDFQSSLA